MRARTRCAAAAALVTLVTLGGLVVSTGSASAQAVPTPPGDLRARAEGDASVALQWADRSTNETGFVVERTIGGADPLQWETVAELGAGVTSHTDRGLWPLTSYSYRVSARSAGGRSAPSTVAADATADRAEPQACSRWAAPAGDDGADGSQASPVRTINALYRVLQPGQTGCLVGGQRYDYEVGTFIVDPSVSGRPGAPKRIRSDGDGKAILRGYAWFKPATHDLVLEDVRWEGCPESVDTDCPAASATFLVHGDRIVLRNVEMTDPRNICLQVGLHGERGKAWIESTGRTLSRSDGFILERSVISGCGSSPEGMDQGSGAHGIYAQAGTGMVFRDNVIAYNTFRGLVVYPDVHSALVERNALVGNGNALNMGAPPPNQWPVFTQEGWKGTSGVIVRDNVIGLTTPTIPGYRGTAEFGKEIIGYFAAGQIEPATGQGADTGNRVYANCMVNPSDQRFFSGRGYWGDGRSVRDANQLLTSQEGVFSRLTAASAASSAVVTVAAGGPCAGKGPRAAAAPTTEMPAGTFEQATSSCTSDSVATAMPSVVAPRQGDREWVFWKPLVFRWTGTAWQRVDEGPWLYGLADRHGLTTLGTVDGTPVVWAVYGGGGGAYGSGATLPFEGLGEGYHAVVEYVWWGSAQHMQSKVASFDTTGTFWCHLRRSTGVGSSPQIVAPAAQRSDERATVNVPLQVTDPDGDSIRLQVTGLPPGLTVADASIVGTIDHRAVSATTSDRSIAAQDFVVTITATDDDGTTTRTFPWTVRDTHLAMPELVGWYGCGNCGSGPDEPFPKLSDMFDETRSYRIAFDPARPTAAPASSIWHQGIAPGQPVAWGQAVDVYFWEAAACAGSDQPACTGGLARGW